MKSYWNSSRARFGKVSPTIGDTTFTVVVTPAVPGGCVEPDGTDLIEPGDTVTVTVSRHVELITPIMSAIIGDVDITAKVEATVQG